MSDPQAVRSRPDGRALASNAPPAVASPLRRLDRRRQVLLLAADAGLAELFFLGALSFVRHQAVRDGAGGSGPLPIVFGILFPIVVASRGLYHLNASTSRRLQSMDGARVVLWSVCLSIGALFLLAGEVPWSVRAALILYHSMLFLWMVAIRPALVTNLQERLAPAAGRDQVLLFGSAPSALEIARKLHTGPGRPAVLGFADEDAPEDARARPFHRIPLSDIPDRAQEIGATLVILARTDIPREQVVRISDALMNRGIQVRVARNVFNTLIDGLPLEGYGGLSLLPVGQTPLSPAEQSLKRAVDVAGVILGGLLVLPFILVLALLVRLSSPGPVLYRQKRIGQGGRAFTFYKFRSMRVQNDDSAHRAYVRGFLENGAAASVDGNGKKIYKLVDDARVTRIGRFLRRTSLDELPQLINVLRGEMSLVGPRPCLPFEYDLYKDWQKRRLDVTPGMTGLWQVTGRSYVNFEDMVLLDLFYIGNWSFSMDMKLLLRTLPVMIWGKGGV